MLPSMLDFLCRIDDAVILFMRRFSGPVARVALFVVYVWFGALKAFGLSPASAMVLTLQHATLPSFIGDHAFMIGFGLFEVLIGILFVIPRAERVAIPLMAAHMIMTALPLVLLPGMVWTGWFLPTLEGQYIIKNIALIAVAMGIASRVAPLRGTMIPWR
jgi:uncharacterized membrane protein YkgB